MIKRKKVEIKTLIIVLGFIFAITPISSLNNRVDTKTSEENQETHKLRSPLPQSYETFIEDFNTITKRHGAHTNVIQWGYGRIINSKVPPNLVGSINFREFGESIWVSGNYVYIGFGEFLSLFPDTPAGLLIVDISDKDNPVRVGLYQTQSKEFYDPYLGTYYIYNIIYDICIIGNYAYASGLLNFQIIDISNPNNPTFVGASDTLNTGYSFGVDVSYPYAYVSCRGIDDLITSLSGLVVIDISNPIRPSIEGRCNTGPIEGIDVSYPYAYVSGEEGNLYIIDISNPSSPSKVGFYKLIDAYDFFDFCVSGNYAYVAGGSLFIIDITNPNSPILVGQYRPLGKYGRVITVHLLENYAYIFSYESPRYLVRRYKIQVIDITSKNNPVVVAETRLEGSYVWSFEEIFISGNYLYLFPRQKDLKIFDITDRNLYVSVCQAQSIQISKIGYVENATFTAVDDILSGTDIEYYLSADGGTHWESVTPGIEHDFVYPGFDLRWRAILSTSDRNIAPSISEIVINYELDEPPTMDPILEPENQYYTSAPIFSHLGFNDDIALDDGWYQIDSYIEEWIPLFFDCGDIEWNYDGWVLPNFDDLSEGYHRIYFKVTDEVGNEQGGSGEWKWGFYKEVGDATPPVIIIEYQDGDRTDGNPGKWNVFAYDDESGINGNTITVLIDGVLVGGTLGDYDVPNTLGEHTISVEVENNDGYLGSESDSIIIIDDDTLKPVIDYIYTGDGTDGNSGEIIVTASDDSGFAIDPSGIYPVPNSLGTHIFVFTATDNDNDRVDDALTRTVEISINIIDDDVTAPVIDIQYIGGGFDDDPGYFEWNVFDIDSGISEINFTISYESTEGLDDYTIYPEGSEIGSWNLPPYLGIYTIEISARDNDDDRTLIVDSLTTELTRDQEIVDDDIDPPELTNLVIIPDIFEINITFDATDESGIGNISTFINGELIEPLTQTQYGNTYSLTFENQWLFEFGTSEVIIQVEDGDDDRPNDTLTSLITGTFENILSQMYEYVDWQLEELKNYIDENLNPCAARFLNKKLTRAQEHLYEAFSYVENGNITCGLFHDAIAKLMVQITEFKVELLNRCDRIDDEQAEYIIDSIHTIRNNILLLMGASTGEEQAYEIALIEVELLNLKDFIKDEIPCCVGRCLSAKISCSAKLLELALLKISMGYTIDCILEYTQCKLEHTIMKINLLLEKGKIPEDVAYYLIEKISSIIGDIEQLKNN